MCGTLGSWYDDIGCQCQVTEFGSLRWMHVHTEEDRNIPIQV